MKNKDIEVGELENLEDIFKPQRLLMLFLVAVWVFVVFIFVIPVWEILRLMLLKFYPEAIIFSTITSTKYLPEMF